MGDIYHLSFSDTQQYVEFVFMPLSTDTGNNTPSVQLFKKVCNLTLCESACVCVNFAVNNI